VRLTSPLSLSLAFASLGLLVPSCFDPTSVVDTDTDGTSGGGTGGTCTPGLTESCVCEDGMSGTQSCAADGSGFGACECGSDSLDSSGTDPTDPTDPTDDTTGPPPECTGDEDCAGIEDGICEVVTCDDGACVVTPDAAGTACGDAMDTECSAPDTCDGAGECGANDAFDGTACTDCPLGLCSCVAGACGDCPAFAPNNNFITTRSIEDWTLTGGWGLYREAPQSFNTGAVLFDSQVFGTDGNRAAPYPASENEMSSAISPPTILPPSLNFRSWNVDEGTNVDNKTIAISTDGGASFQTILDCNTAPPGVPFCQFRNDDRAADDWDDVMVPVPAPMQGQVGQVRFTYDTLDSCCNFEKGWFIDEVNFATECACVGDEGCAGLGGECGPSVCGATGECELDAVAADTACGDAVDSECNGADTCDGAGYCLANQADNGLTACGDCLAGPGGCGVCQGGSCPTCVDLPSTNNFSGGLASITGWVIEDLSGTGSDMRIYSSAPMTESGLAAVPLSLGSAFGTDGNNQTPYGDSTGEVEHSRVTTPPDIVPVSITFNSWHADEGGNPFDTKLIELSVDGGVSWNVLADCNAGTGQAFCLFEPVTRAGNDYDFISLPTAGFAGMVGQLRITYDTVDAGGGDARGWFIDNLNFAQACNDPQFP
jgi:hypothetical protein